MANFSDLFGTGGRAPAVKFDSPGDEVIGVISDEPIVEQETDWATKAPKFMVKNGEKWGPALEGEFDKAEHDHFPLMKIVLPITKIDGSEATIHFAGGRKDALKAAMEETGLPVEAGVTVAVRFERSERTARGGNKKIYTVKLARA